MTHTRATLLDTVATTGRRFESSSEASEEAISVSTSSAHKSFAFKLESDIALGARTSPLCCLHASSTCRTASMS
eukprot:3113525-Prymnesium_polylepis.1